MCGIVILCCCLNCLLLLLSIVSGRLRVWVLFRRMRALLSFYVQQQFLRFVSLFNEMLKSLNLNSWQKILIFISDFCCSTC